MSQLRKRKIRNFFSNTFTTEGDRNPRIIPRLTVECKRYRFQLPSYSDAIAVEGVKEPSRKKYLHIFVTSGQRRICLPLHCGRTIVLLMLL